MAPRPGSQRRWLRWLAWSATLFILVMCGLVLAVHALLHSSILKDRIVTELSKQLDSDVALDRFEIHVLPLLRLTGEGLTVRQRGGSRNATIAVRKFIVEPGYSNLFHGRADSVRVEGMTITIPPSPRAVPAPGTPARVPPARTPPPASTAAAPASSATGTTSDDAAASDSAADDDIRLGHMSARDVQVIFLPATAGKAPRTYDVHTLSVDRLSGHTVMPFEVELTNPKPAGLIKTRGTLGPWNGPSPADTPITGDFQYIDADFDSINGLGGTLSAQGAYRGLLSQLTVTGDTDTPDFQLDRSGHALHLTTKFEARVDGTNGDTYLDRVDGMLAGSSIQTKGRVVAAPKGGRLIDLTLSVPKGQIQDFLTLVLPAEHPLLTGALVMATRFTLPPGKGRVLDRLELDGHFNIREAVFGNPELQARVESFSQHGIGADVEQAGAVRSVLDGKFRMADASIALPVLKFSVPGVNVDMAGVYGLDPSVLDFQGQIRLDATPSRAAGGVKGFFLTAVDPLFKGAHAGTLVPIRVTGTQQHPKVGVEMRKIIDGK